MSVQDLAQLKKLAEAATSGEWVVREYPGGHIGVDVKNAKPDWKTDIFHPRVGSDGYGGGGSSREDAEYICAANPSTILALLSELEQAETRHCKFMVEGGPVVMATEYDEVKAKLKASEAALRTLREASAAVSQKVNNAVFVTELKEEITALAAALAAEGGK